MLPKQNQLVSNKLLGIILKMPTLKENWDVKMAMAVLENKTIDAQLWSEAVEWLMLYGPTEIQELLNKASSVATNQEFPELSPAGHHADGTPLYDIAELAKSLGISEEDALKNLQKKEEDQKIQHLFSDEESLKIQ